MCILATYSNDWCLEQFQWICHQKNYVIFPVPIHRHDVVLHPVYDCMVCFIQAYMLHMQTIWVGCPGNNTLPFLTCWLYAGFFLYFPYDPNTLAIPPPVSTWLKPCLPGPSDATFDWQLIWVVWKNFVSFPEFNLNFIQIVFFNEQM